tara:strand:+ start:205 stop:459 length:255 start_codon:yes stop_codon:yes gene_type:complete
LFKLNETLFVSKKLKNIKNMQNVIKNGKKTLIDIKKLEINTTFPNMKKVIIGKKVFCSTINVSISSLFLFLINLRRIKDPLPQK